MTDAPQPRIRSGSPRTNPAPRSALPRVTPLGSAGDPSAAGAADFPVGSTPVDAGQPATGRDLLIPNGPEQTRRKPRSPATVPTLAELMPAPEQRATKKPHATAATRVSKEHPERVPAKRKHGKGKAGPDLAAKEAALQVTLSKGLRKRLKTKASELGLSSEAAVAQLVEVWVDG